MAPSCEWPLNPLLCELVAFAIGDVFRWVRAFFEGTRFGVGLNEH